MHFSSGRRAVYCPSMSGSTIKGMPSDPAATRTFLDRVKVRNYKSIGRCDISLRSLNVFVGRNGSGKSNFLDALRFVVDSLQATLDHAIKTRGGIDSVRRRSTGHPRNFAIELDINLAEWCVGTYGFEIAARPRGGFAVKKERLRVRNARGETIASYDVEEAKVVECSVDNPPPAVLDRLYLVAASGLPPFRETYDALTSMGFYSLNPTAMKELQTPDAGELLHPDGGNIASVIGRLGEEGSHVKERIKSYLETIVPGISEVDRAALGPRETLEFRQKVVGSTHPWRFYAVNMSDGTLRALGILVAVTQLTGRTTPVRLVGVEEPEIALHPAAAGALMDALREAASHTQVIVTTHSPEFLDQVRLQEDALFVVVSRQGTTEIAMADQASRRAIKDHLYSPGELQRMDQLAPDEADLERQRQMVLFDLAEEEP